MAMTRGTVAIDQNTGAVSGSGFARELFDELLSVNPLSPVPTLGSTTAPYSTARPAAQSDIDAANAGNIRLLNSLRDQANSISVIVTYIQANAQVDVSTLVAHVTTEVLGKTPTPAVLPDTDIQPPASPVDIPVTDGATDLLPVL